MPRAPQIAPLQAGLHCLPPNFMKPNIATSRQVNRLDREQCSSTKSRHPLIEYQFRTALEERQFSGTGSNPKQTQPLVATGFHTLSNRFFNTEAKQDYAVEAIFFAIIVAISAWPVASMIQALAYLWDK